MLARIASIILVFQIALAAQVNLEIESKRVTDYSKQKISVTLNNSANAGIMAFQGRLFYNSELIKVKDLIVGDNSIVGSDGLFLFNNDSSNSKVNFAWANTFELAEEGLLFELVFTIMKPGQSYITTINPDNGEETFFVNNGSPASTVTIGEITGIAPYVSLSDLAVEGSNQCSISLILRNFNEVGSLSFILDYPENITYNSVSEIYNNLNLSVTSQGDALYIGWFDLTTSNSITVDSTVLCRLVLSNTSLSGNLSFRPISEITDPLGNKLPVKFEDFEISPQTGIKESVASRNFQLVQNYPNPFNPVTTIKYNLPEASMVKLSVFNALGECIDILLNSEMNAGYHSIEWNAANLATGIYFYTIEAHSVNGLHFSRTMKMIMMK